MGKKKEKGEMIDSDSPTTSTVKKSKKHKHKKSSKKEEVEKFVNVEEMEDVFVLVDELEDGSSSPAIKLKIKVPETTPEKISPTPSKSVPKPKCDKLAKLPGSKKSGGKKKDGKGEDDTDSEEERWLDAIESGKLEEVDDELKRMKNPRLMTARQRAMLEKRTDGADDTFPIIPAEPLLALPSGFKEKVVTEEMLAKKAIKSEKRRAQAQEKREEDKKKTVDRLLKKQDSKIAKYSRLKSSKTTIPVYTYLDNSDGISISVPVGSNFPLQTQTKIEAPEIKLCGILGCKEPKKYCCSKTGLPLCSLQCYKINLANTNLISVS